MVLSACRLWLIRMYKCRIFSAKDSDSVRELIKTTFYDFLDGDYWDWKYLRNPYFDPSLVAVAENNGEVIGCSHGIPRKFKITEDVEVNSVLGGDLAVRPEYRGQGLGKELLLQCRTQGTIKNQKIALFYHFTNVNLAKEIHIPFFGDAEVTPSIKQFYKITSWKKLVSLMEDKNIKQALYKKVPSGSKDLDFIILFRMTAAPPLTLRFSKENVDLSEEECENADITIEGNLATFTSFLGGKNIKWQLLKAILKRKLKIKGKPWKLLKAYRDFDFFKTFAETITKYMR